MKKSLLLCFLLVSGSTLMAQGIEFRQDEPFEKVLEIAKKENKIIFVDGYTQVCAPCKQLDRETFPLQKVGDYFNSNFINVKYDLDKEEGKKLHQQYKDVITGYPSLILIDQNGKMIHKIGGFHTGDSLIAKMDAALKQQKSLSVMRARYQAGEKSIGFVREYQQILKDAYMNDFPGSEGDKVRLGILARLTDDEMLNAEMWGLIGSSVKDPYSPGFERVLKNLFRFQQQHVTDIRRLEFQLKDAIRMAADDIVKVTDDGDKITLHEDTAKQAKLMKYLTSGPFSMGGLESVRAKFIVHDLALAADWSNMVAALKFYDAIKTIGMDPQQMVLPYLRYMLRYCEDKKVLADASAMLQYATHTKPGEKVPDSAKHTLYELYKRAGNKQMADKYKDI